MGVQCYNIDLSKCNSDKITGDYVNMLFSNNFLPTIIMPTRITLKSATIIDHIYYYGGNHRGTFMSGNIFADITDHLPNWISIHGNSGSPNVKINRPFIRLYNTANITRFKKDLQETDWSELMQSVSDVNSDYDCFITILKNKIDLHFPLTRLSNLNQG